MDTVLCKLCNRLEPLAMIKLAAQRRLKRDLRRKEYAEVEV